MGIFMKEIYGTNTFMLKKSVEKTKFYNCFLTISRTAETIIGFFTHLKAFLILNLNMIMKNLNLEI